MADDVILIGLVGGTIGLILATLLLNDPFNVKQGLGLTLPTELGPQPGTFVTVDALQLFGNAPNLTQLVKGIF